MLGTDIQIAKQQLMQGNLVAIPTETVYGLAANAFNPTAVAKIYAAKNRPAFNPLIIHTNNLSKLKSWGLVLPDAMLKLAEVFSPGPITYVLPKSERIPDLVTAGTNAVAVRIPNHALTLQLLSQLDFPLAAPSANPSGFVSPTNALHVQQYLQNEVGYILDGGQCDVGVESSIISFIKSTPELLRYGAISLEQIQAVIGNVVDVQKENHYAILTDNPIAPGALAKHYATKHKLIFDDPLLHINNYNKSKIGIVSFKNKYEGVPNENQFVLSPQGNLSEAANKLFAALRQLNNMDVDVILAEVFPNEGIGMAINDRLRRAGVE